MFSLNICIYIYCRPRSLKLQFWSLSKTKAQADLFRLLQSFVAEFVARHGSLMQSLWLDEITLKAACFNYAPGSINSQKMGMSLIPSFYRKLVLKDFTELG